MFFTTSRAAAFGRRRRPVAGGRKRPSSPVAHMLGDPGVSVDGPPSAGGAGAVEIA